MVELADGFRVWRYGIGHSELVMRSNTDTRAVGWSPGQPGEPDEWVEVIFEGVRAVQVRTVGSYKPLRLSRVDEERRPALLQFARIPDRWHHRTLCLEVSDHQGEPGFVVCGRARVMAVSPAQVVDPKDPTAHWPQTRTLHDFGIR